MKVLYEEEDFVIIEKPVGISSQEDGSGSDAISVMNKLIGGKCFPVHRLDKTTGGALIIAKNSVSAGEISEIVSKRGVFKEYLAVLSKAPDEKEGVLRDLLFWDRQRQKSFIADRARRGVKEAELEYNTVSVSESGRTLIKVVLHTGRTHQIRVQFSSRGLALVGDGRYGSHDKARNIALWSSKISFEYHGKRAEAVSLPCAEEFPWNEFAGFFTGS